MTVSVAIQSEHYLQLGCWKKNGSVTEPITLYSFFCNIYPGKHLVITVIMNKEKQKMEREMRETQEGFFPWLPGLQPVV